MNLLLPVAFLSGSPGMSELLLISAVVLLLFGPKRLPEIARMIGRTLDELRKASQDFRDQIMQIDESVTKDVVDDFSDIASDYSDDDYLDADAADSCEDEYLSYEDDSGAEDFDAMPEDEPSSAESDVKKAGSDSGSSIAASENDEIAEDDGETKHDLAG